MELKRIELRLLPEQYDKFKKVATLQQISMASLLRLLINKEIKKYANT